MSKWTTKQAILNGGERAKQIIRALKGKEIRVTKQMVRDGHREACKSCPVALALLTILPGADVRADYDCIEVDGCVRFETPERAERFMRKFDRCSTRRWLSGFRFTLTDLQQFYCRPKPAIAAAEEGTDA